MPSVPRIIIPDGTSINLSTPPTTPRQPYKAPLPSIVSNQPYNFQQIMEKLRSQGLLANRKNQVLHFCRAIGSKKSVIDNQQQESHQSLDGTVSTAGQVELTELNAAEGQEASSDMNKNHSDPSSLEEDHQPHYMSELGVIGFQMGGRNISVLSSEKYIWWDYEESTEGLFSKERWRRVLCSRPGLSNIFKYLITTSLGLITILAISLTALGKIKNYQQVSDNIPTSLANSVMEAQIVVIKDFNRFQQSNLAKDRYVQLEDQSQLKTSPKVPVWTRPIRQGCFHEKCDIEDLGKEYFAFMVISLGLIEDMYHCIEISRNQFVYRTKVRILGDLTTCTDDLTQVRGSVDSNTPAFTSQSIPIPRPTAMPLDQKFHRRKYKLSESHSNEYTPRSSKSIEKNQGLGASVSSDPLTQVLATARLPYLIVDPSTFNNLTMYDTQASLLLMDLLQVQFRFVLCDI
ncbi:hypothetical protein FBU30_002064 [Linnemannia zychae]|nr:hypothetical protein FBU30_002064 [Linnemannia zychae]